MSATRQKRDTFPLQVAAVGLVVVVAGAAAAIELTIFRHGPGGTLGTIGTALLVAGTAFLAVLAIRIAGRSDAKRAKIWAWLLCGSVAYFVVASLLAEPLYQRGTFALGAPRSVTAQRQITRAEAEIGRIEANRATTGYTEDQRWSLAVARSQIKAAQADLVYSKAVKDSEQVYPQYPVGGEPGPYQQHLRQLVEQVLERRKQQGYPVSEPLPGYLLLPSSYLKKIATLEAAAAGSKQQADLCKTGTASGYRGIDTPNAIKNCEWDWMRESKHYQEAADYNRSILDYQRRSFASIAP